ncbi:tannase and feruloyl esterase [Phellopilus nigrolimitatus]|nr:tannase and feruloyl esterase [Phellopilus nigrolimitatus]
MLNGVLDKSFSFLRQATSNWQILGPALSVLAPSQFDSDPTAACASFYHDPTLAGLNTTILNATYYENATAVGTLGVCQPTAQISAPLCRVQFIVNTSDVSAITAEAWFPTDWNGRFLGLGNGGLGGCIDYDDLGYGASLGFASVASNNGHDGNSGVVFENKPEVLLDFTSRAVHVEAVAGKQLVAMYYGRAHRRAYYLGCSTGGRQGVYAALHHPADFDGILAGAPATNMNHLLGHSAMLSKYNGAPNLETNPSFISPALWDVVSAEILRQCDALDGIADGIITEPDACEFRPEEIQCTSNTASNCLTATQVEALRKIYAPLYGLNGELLFPRFDPGAEASPRAQSFVFARIPQFAYDWMKYVINNGSDYDFNNFGLADIALMDERDPGKISTFSGDFSAFRARGGKLISYHGRSDELIPSGNAKSLYNLAARTLGLHAEMLDSFYRLFLVPGMCHCLGGAGAVNFGQNAHAVPQEVGKPPEQSSKSQVASLKADNVLLALVEWVEHGHAPDTITGVSKDGKLSRVHCRYPHKSVWDGEKYTCVS